MQAEEALDTIRKEVNNCRACKLSENRKNAIPGEGPTSAKVMFIGEGPGFHENEQGKPFVGQAGKLLDQLLDAAGLQREEVYITNVVKCRPPQNRDPEPEELAMCSGYLERQIDVIKPKVIVTLGRFSMAHFVENGKIGAIHGKSHLVKDQLVVTMYHPAAALHQPGLKGTLMADFTGIRHLLDELHQDEKIVKAKPIAQKHIEIKEEQKPENVTPEQLNLF